MASKPRLDVVHDTRPVNTWGRVRHAVAACAKAAVLVVVFCLATLGGVALHFG